ncbi:RNA polymerase factor sigma-54 [Vulgatibacter incomptus]|uniref:RNA polymerase sigma-54 factor RpoN n=1 Tax=Vulgatibacter incomptus TaxID=1391653 RepID=A0A0K1PD74_9BACT|nr:RNA polymerase sigma-54 factor [Vulgatibacter incomptus]AKU91351.1 RNA polymerase sigma-54 factor RpoN [Vulgatibacter incomptus]
MSIELESKVRLDLLPPGPAPSPRIDLLRLSRRELASRIRDEVERNPLLEERTNTLEQDRHDAVRELSSIERFAAQEDAAAREPLSDPDWEDGVEELAEELLSSEGDPEQELSLLDHLVTQMRLTSFSPDEERVSKLILGNLDEDGYFRLEDVEGDPLIAVAGEAEVGLDVAAGALRKLQQLEPTGVCARDLEECLLLQARAWGEDRGLVGAIIRKHLPALEARGLRSIASDLDAELGEVIVAERIIAEMEPRPARAFLADESPFILPDVQVHRSGNEWIVTADDPLARIRISRRYRGSLRRESPAADFLRENLHAARALIDSVEGRQRILVRMVEAIARLRTELFERGPSAAVPLDARDVAAEVGLHPSTVLGAAAGKLVATPNGVLPLASFFAPPLDEGMAHVDEVTDELEQEILDLVSSEPPRRPYSDHQLVELLRVRRLEASRPLVSRCRELLGIPPTSERSRR